MDVNAGMLQIKAEKLKAFPKTALLYLNFRIEKLYFGTIIFRECRKPSPRIDIMSIRAEGASRLL
jgi:hypothetical protein